MEDAERVSVPSVLFAVPVHVHILAHPAGLCLGHVPEQAAEVAHPPVHAPMPVKTTRSAHVHVPWLVAARAPFQLIAADSGRRLAWQRLAHKPGLMPAKTAARTVLGGQAWIDHGT